jgi:hypothetical protein
LLFFISAVPITTLFAWGEGDSGGHVLCETMSRGLCRLVCPSRTNERGGEGECVKEGGGEEGERKRERSLGLLFCHNPRMRLIHNAAALASASQTLLFNNW